MPSVPPNCRHLLMPLLALALLLPWHLSAAQEADYVPTVLITGGNRGIGLE